MKNHNYVVILVGVCGTGKSNIGQRVAQVLNIPFFDADKLSVTKELPEGQLPQEIDLEKWFNSLKKLIVGEVAKKGCVISCSVLKREHRRMLTAHIDHQLDWVFMKGSYEFVLDRVERNGNHDRPAKLLKADFDTLEVPKRALTIDMNYSEQEMVDTILKYLARKYE